MIKALSGKKVFYLLLLLIVLLNIVSAIKTQSWQPLIPIIVGWTMADIIASIILGLFLSEPSPTKED